MLLEFYGPFNYPRCPQSGLKHRKQNESSFLTLAYSSIAFCVNATKILNKPWYFSTNTLRALHISFMKCMELKNHSSSNHPLVCCDHRAAKACKEEHRGACGDGVKTSSFEDYFF